jgi:hypothetical protein
VQMRRCTKTELAVLVKDAELGGARHGRHDHDRRDPPLASPHAAVAYDRCASLADLLASPEQAHQIVRQVATTRLSRHHIGEMNLIARWSGCR